MDLRIDQLKKIKVPLDGSCNSCSTCAPLVSMYDILGSYQKLKPYNFYTKLPVTGTGTQNNPLTISIAGAQSGSVLTFNGNAWVAAMPSNVAPTLTFSSPFLSISGGNTVDLSALSDPNQTLSIVGFDLSISNGNTVNLPTSWQTLSLVGNTLSIGPNGNSVNLASLAGGYHTIQNAGSAVTQRSVLNFVNTPALQVTDDTVNNRTNVTMATNLVHIANISPAIGSLIYFNGTSWEKVNHVKNVQTGILTNTVTLPSTPVATMPIDIYLNGILKEEGQDYTISGATITWTFNLISTDKITTKYFV